MNITKASSVTSTYLDGVSQTAPADITYFHIHHADIRIGSRWKNELCFALLGMGKEDDCLVVHAIDIPHKQEVLAFWITDVGSKGESFVVNKDCHAGREGVFPDRRLVDDSGERITEGDVAIHIHDGKNQQLWILNVLASEDRRSDFHPGNATIAIRPPVSNHGVGDVSVSVGSENDSDVLTSRIRRL